MSNQHLADKSLLPFDRDISLCQIRLKFSLKELNMDIDIATLPKRVTVENYQSILKELRTYETVLCNMPEVTGTESMGNSFFNVWVGLTDILSRLGNNFKTNVTKFYLDLKRSELRYYSEMHARQVASVEALSIDQVLNVELPAPSGMFGSYKEATESIQSVYNTLNADTVLNNANQCFNNIYRSVSIEDGKHRAFLAQFVNFSKEYAGKVKLAIDAMNKHFTADRTGNEPFSKSYKSMEEFRQVRQLLIGMEGHLQAIARLEKNHAAIIHSVENLTLVFQKDTTVIDKPFLQDLSEMVRMTATVFETYGIAAQRQCALEHNHVEAIRALYLDVVTNLKPSNEGLPVKRVVSTEGIADNIMMGLGITAIVGFFAVMFGIIGTLIYQCAARWKRIKARVKFIDKQSFKQIKTTLPDMDRIDHISDQLTEAIEIICDSLIFDDYQPNRATIAFNIVDFQHALHVIGCEIDPHTYKFVDYRNVFEMEQSTCGARDITPYAWGSLMEDWSHQTSSMDLLKSLEAKVANIKNLKLHLDTNVVKSRVLVQTEYDREEERYKTRNIHFDDVVDMSEAQARVLLTSIGMAAHKVATTIKTLIDEILRIETQVQYTDGRMPPNTLVDRSPSTEGMNIFAAGLSIIDRGLLGVYWAAVGIVITILVTTLAVISAITTVAIMRWNRIRVRIKYVDEVAFGLIKTKLPHATEIKKMSDALEVCLDNLDCSIELPSNPDDPVKLFLYLPELSPALETLGYNINIRTYKVSKVKDIFNVTPVPCNNIGLTPKIVGGLLEDWSNLGARDVRLKKLKDVLTQLKSSKHSLQIKVWSPFINPNDPTSEELDGTTLSEDQGKVIIQTIGDIFKLTGTIYKELSDDIFAIEDQMTYTDGRTAGTEGLFGWGRPKSTPAPKAKPAAKTYTKEQIDTLVKKIISEQLGVNVTKVTDNANIKTGLGVDVDSLDAIEIVMALEEEFGFDIPDKDAESVVTVNAVVAYIAKRLKEDNSSM